eukprot:8047531-Karenia_brevis.AAC.1
MQNVMIEAFVQNSYIACCGSGQQGGDGGGERLAGQQQQQQHSSNKHIATFSSSNCGERRSGCKGQL